LTSDPGRIALDELRPFDAWDMAKIRWAMLEEMMDLIRYGREIPFSAIPDISELLRIREGAALEGQDIIQVGEALKGMYRLKESFNMDDSTLSRLAGAMVPLDGLQREIDTALTPTGEVSDRHHPALRELRKRHRSHRSLILERMDGILQRLKDHSVVMEDIITTRADRYVMPLRLDYSSQIRGITHDFSRTKKTVYVEPLELVDENNTLNELKSRIKEEEFAILRDLTSRIVEEARSIRDSLKVYGDLDCVHASARYALKTGATIPELSSGEFVLSKACHPVLFERLGKDRTVAVDIRIPEGKNCLIISGPNAGGKTVALKTLGLLVLMAKSGLAIPACDNSRMPPVGRIWVEMDTGQDIEHDLSTFTAHALCLKKIFEHASPGDLVLLDEPGTGTDPEHGSAIAVACIDELCKKGAYVVVTSHAEKVKLYGLSSPRVEYAATGYDDATLKPLYTLKYNMIGQSRAFEILQSIDFPGGLIEQARSIVAGSGNSALCRAMEDLQETQTLRDQASKELEDACALKQQALAEAREAQRQKISQAIKYRRLLERLERLADTQQLQEVKHRHEAAELTETLAEMEHHARETLKLDKGVQVSIEGSQMVGEVIDISNDSAEVLAGNKRLIVDIDRLAVVAGSRAKSRSRKTRTEVRSNPVVFPIKVVGMRVDDALPIVASALDRAMLSGQKNIEIIHGTGTGALKKAIRDYLKRIPGVKSFSDSPLPEGAGAKTIVELEDNE